MRCRKRFGKHAISPVILRPVLLKPRPARRVHRSRCGWRVSLRFVVVGEDRIVRTGLVPRVAVYFIRDEVRLELRELNDALPVDLGVILEEVALIVPTVLLIVDRGVRDVHVLIRVAISSIVARDVRKR